MFRLDELDAPSKADLVAHAPVFTVHGDLEGNAAHRVSHDRHVIGTVASLRHGGRAGDELEGIAVKSQAGGIRAEGCHRRVIGDRAPQSGGGKGDGRRAGIAGHDIVHVVPVELNKVTGLEGDGGRSINGNGRSALGVAVAVVDQSIAGEAAQKEEDHAR